MATPQVPALVVVVATTPINRKWRAEFSPLLSAAVRLSDPSAIWETHSCRNRNARRLAMRGDSMCNKHGTRLAGPFSALSR